ncbi:MAG: SufD family Fe-S cluster assembly protein [Acidaminococcaceae bacterium]
MKEIAINRLPILTYRYLKTNDTKILFSAPQVSATADFSDKTYVAVGAEFPENFEGASTETLAAALAGEKYTITIPSGMQAKLTIEIKLENQHADYAGAYHFLLKKGAKLELVWKLSGKEAAQSSYLASYYELEDAAELKISKLQADLAEATLYDQRFFKLAKAAKAASVAAELGGKQVIVHSRGTLNGDEAALTERIVYTGTGKQHLDLFYQIDHWGKKTVSLIDGKGALAGEAKKIFRSTLDFHRGCAGSEGEEGDYAVQLSPKAKNISLPLLLCTEDNVVGNHATSAGQVSEEDVYYLMSRGFSQEEARRIIVESLMRPIVDSLDASLQEEALEEIRRKLDAKGE